MMKLKALTRLIRHMENLEVDNQGILSIDEVDSGIEMKFYNKFNTLNTYYQPNKKTIEIEENDYTADYESKVQWLLENDFRRDYDNENKTDIFIYDGYVLIREQVEDTNLAVIKKYKDWYDENITEEELDKFVELNS